MQSVKQLKTHEAVRIEKINRDAVAEYENLVWRLAESNDDPGDCGAILYSADKSWDDFVKDVEAISKRIASYSHVAEFAKIESELKLVAEKRAKVASEKAEAVKQFDKQLESFAREAQALSTRQKELRPAVVHAKRSCPAWLREKIDATRKSLIGVQRKLKSLRAPAPPLHPSEMVMAPVNFADMRNQMDQSYERAKACYDEKQSKYQRLRRDLPQREAELQRRVTGLEAQALQLRPAPEKDND